MEALNAREAEEVLLRACVLQDWKGINFALSRGASVSCRDREGRTPLHLAVMGCADDIARFLVARGAAVNAQDSKGDTPLHYAARWQWPALLLPFLVHPDLNLSLRNNADRTAAEVTGEVPRPPDDPIAAEMHEALADKTRPPELRLQFALRRWVEGMGEVAVPAFRSRAKIEKIAELKNAARFGDPGLTSTILSEPTLRGRLARWEEQLSPLLEHVATAASGRGFKPYVSLDADPITLPGEGTTLCIRIQSPHSLELAGFLADALARSGAKGVRVQPLDQFGLGYATLGDSATVSFQPQGLDQAAFDQLLKTRLSRFDGTSYTLFDELDRAAEVHCHVEASLAFPAADGAGFVIVTQHPRAVAAATRRRHEFTISEPTFIMDWSSVESSAGFRHSPIAIQGKHLQQLFSSVRQDELWR